MGRLPFTQREGGPELLFPDIPRTLCFLPQNCNQAVPWPGWARAMSSCCYYRSCVSTKAGKGQNYFANTWAGR